MSRKVALLFSGQGSQYYQMGRGLYEQNHVFKSCMDCLDRLAQDMLGTSIVRELYGPLGKGEALEDIRITHPAIFMVEFSLAKCIMELGITPSCTIGASLGTFAALAVAGWMSASDALSLVIHQALAIDKHCPKGVMIAVLNDPLLYEDSPFLQARSVLAGRNFASHFVLSAPLENQLAIERFLARSGVTSQRLPVQYPFHSPWIDPIRDVLLESSRTDQIRISSTPVVCCAQGDILRVVNDDYFWQVAREEIGFMRAMVKLDQSGPYDYLDIGPSGTLATFMRYLLPKQSGSRSFAVMTPYGRDAELLASVSAQVLAGSVPVAAGV
jgi:bacillaene synthase trans-acting acyltransferase